MVHDDEKHLSLLSIFHYVCSGVTALFACFPIVHVLAGIMILSGKFFAKSQQIVPPREMGWVFIIFGSVFILMGWALAICMFIAGRKLKLRKNRIFCMVIAGVECIFIPLGTVLGVFTIIILNRDSVEKLFEPQPRQNLAQ